MKICRLHFKLLSALVGEWVRPLTSRQGLRQQRRKRNYAICYDWYYEHLITDWGQNNTGAKWYFCPGCSAGTGEIFPLPLWSRRLWWRVHRLTTPPCPNLY